MALRRQAEALGVRYGLEVSVLATEPELGPSAKHALYRIAAEAMHNVIKHARASRLRGLLGDGELVVEDDGEGFDPGSATSGFGLGTMRERAAQAGGSLEVSSAPGRGTRVVARV